mmetsp:Transcript_10215/g.19322  ORF Transcript_10215/g.19322 Transcript_10215/m.19322 type:complete len:181 (+) Transcript_10215:78-620(+)
MGLIFSSLWQKLFAFKQFKVCLVGLDNAGKTTTLFRLHLGEVVQTQPTIGSNVEEVIHKNIHFQMWDLGGQESLRSGWSTYYINTHAIIMVVDSADRERISIVKAELFKLLSNELLKTAVLLVYANKQDSPNKMSAAEIATALNLTAIKSHPWHIQPCSALKGEGLYEGVDWLTAKVTSR